jgi:hypothetical protein
VEGERKERENTHRSTQAATITTKKGREKRKTKSETVKTLSSEFKQRL